MANRLTMAKIQAILHLHEQDWPTGESFVRRSSGGKAARKNASETSTLYREGLANALSAADANQSLFEADVARTRELYTLGAAVLDLYAAQGLDPEGKEPVP